MFRSISLLMKPMEKLDKSFYPNIILTELIFSKKPVFPSTSYFVCAFAFHREKNHYQRIFCCVPEENDEFYIDLKKLYDYRYYGEIYEIYKRKKNCFSRLLQDKEPEGFITNLKLYGLDTRTEPIHIAYETEPYYGKSTDRIYLTFVCERELSEEQQKALKEEFNWKINFLRKEYHNLLFTNYRDYNRKRIGFDFAYKLLSAELERMDEN